MAVDDRLLLISPSLGFGGMEFQLLELARAAARRGRPSTVLAGDGPLAEDFSEVADLELIDWDRSRALTARRARKLAAGCAVTVLQADPALLHLLPSLAGAGPVHLCVHNRPGTFETWLHPAVLERFERLVPALHASGQVAFTASSSTFAVEHARRLGLPRGAVTAWYPGVDAPPGHETLSSGPVHSVAVVCRLSPEKLPIVAAGAELVAAGVADGADVRLDVYGSGESEQDARRLVAAGLPDDAYRLHGATDRPLSAAARADVVVNGGRGAIEALAVGRRVVTPVLGPGRDAGHVGPLVEPARFEELKGRNFVGDRPRDPAATWHRLEALTEADVRALRDATRQELGGEAVLEGHLAAVARTRPPRGGAADPLLDAVIELALDLEDGLAAAQRTADDLWAHR